MNSRRKLDRSISGYDEMQLFDLYNENSFKYPVIVTIPHSGTYIPSKIKNLFIKNPIPVLTNMDWYLDKLYSFLQEMNVTVLKFNYSRYVVDVNRGPNKSLVGSYKKSVISKRTLFDKPIYSGDLSTEDIRYRIEKFYRPFHAKLDELVQHRLQKFEKVYIFDIHSFGMPIERDIVVGNDDGKTSSEKFLSLIIENLEKQGFNAAKNVVWKGGYIVKKYGANSRVESVIIEIKFNKYLEERIFYEEEFPSYNPEIFANAQKTLKLCFQSILSNLN